MSVRDFFTVEDVQNGTAQLSCRLHFDVMLFDGDYQHMPIINFRSRPIKAQKLRQMDHQKLSKQLEAWTNA